MNVMEQTQNLYARSALVQLVARLLHDPKSRRDGGLEESLDEALEQAFLRAPHTDFPEAAGVIEELCEAIEPRELDAQYRRTFGHIPAGYFSPYETSYAWDNAFAQSQHLADISGFYTAFGVQTAEVDRERPDHLGAETEFLSLLLYKEAVALEEKNQEAAEICRAARRRFLEEHLGRWGTVVLERLEQEAPDQVYQLCGRLGRELLLSEIRAAGARCAALERADPPKEGIAENFCPELFSCPGSQGSEEM